MMAVWSKVRKSELHKGLRIDAEFYQPEHLEEESAIQSGKFSRLGELLDVFYRYPTCYGFEFADSGIPFLKGEDIEHSGFVESKSGDCITPEISAEYPLTLLQEHDIIISVRGSVGKVGLIHRGLAGAQISPNLIRAKVNKEKIDPLYLWLFLNSGLGQRLFQRFKMRTSQETIVSSDMKDFPVPLPDDRLLATLNGLVRDARAAIVQSKELYASAEALLLAELALTDLDLSPTLFYERSFSETQQAARLDSEFFQPAYESVVDACTSYKGGTQTLAALLESMTNGVECRTFAQEGVPYIRVGDMRRLRIAAPDAVRISHKDAERLSRKIALRPGDVLTARSGSIGQACVVTQEVIDSILSSHLMRLRLREDCPVLSEYLALFLASTAGIQQVLKNGNGGIVPEISQPFMKRIVVPIPPTEHQERLCALIQQSHAAEDESRRLLEEAKRMVEQAVSAQKTR